MPQTQTSPATWASIRHWLEQPLQTSKGKPTGPARLEVYKIKVLQRATATNASVYRYLARKLHRGQIASPPAEAQLAKLLPLLVALGYPHSSWQPVA